MQVDNTINGKCLLLSEIREIYFNSTPINREIIGSIVPLYTNYIIKINGKNVNIISRNYYHKYTPIKLRYILNLKSIEDQNQCCVILDDNSSIIYNNLSKLKNSVKLCMICMNNTKSKPCNDCASLICKKCYHKGNHFCLVCEKQIYEPSMLSYLYTFMFPKKTPLVSNIINEIKS
jgi:hypothetical protein